MVSGGSDNGYSPNSNNRTITSAQRKNPHKKDSEDKISFESPNVN